MCGSLRDVSLGSVVGHAKSYGFIYPSSELYGHLQGVYDYGPYGSALKERIRLFWMRSLTQLRSDVVALDAAILMHGRVWEASGHAQHFHDLFVEHLNSNRRYRVDQLIADKVESYIAGGQTKVADGLRAEARKLLEALNKSGLKKLLETHQVVCKEAGTAEWSEVRELNLMFATQSNSDAEALSNLYLRPETAQGVYVNFENVQKSLRLKVPFGVAQVGKAFRNELIARQFTFRMREFEQMELQYFIPPSTHSKWFSYWQSHRLNWYATLGLDTRTHLRVRPHEQLAHYAQAASDIEYCFPFGWREIEGIHARGDFDLSRHSQHASKKIQYFDAQTNTHYTPHVLEASAGLDRLVLMLLCHAYRQEEKRLYLALPPALAPVQLAVFPLLKKDGLPEVAQQIVAELKTEFQIAYEESASIGKRYARQDLIGTPFCATIDHQTLADDTVTLRDRDSTEQKRLSIHKLKEHLTQHVSITSLLNQLKKLCN